MDNLERHTTAQLLRPVTRRRATYARRHLAKLFLVVLAGQNEYVKEIVSQSKIKQN